MKNSTILSKSRIISLSAFILATIASCEKEKVVNENPVLDKHAFISFYFDDTVFTSYGYIDDGSTIPYGGPTLTQSIGLNTIGDSVGKVVLQSEDLYTGTNNSDQLKLGNCKMMLSMQKDELDLLGLYTEFGAPLGTHAINKNTAEEYFINDMALRLTLDSVVEHPVNKAPMVEGWVSGSIFTSVGGFRYIPFAGNFRMYLEK